MNRWRNCTSIETAVSEINIFVSSAGHFNISTLDHMKKLNNTFAGNTRNFNNEIDLASSEGLDGMKVDNNTEDVSLSMPIVHARMSSVVTFD